MVLIKVIGLVQGFPTSFDGQYLAEYDPNRRGTSPEGEPMLAHIRTTPDPGKALKFPTGIEALEEWRRVSTEWPIREDGKPNRPLTAFHCEIMGESVAR